MYSMGIRSPAQSFAAEPAVSQVTLWLNPASVSASGIRSVTIKFNSSQKKRAPIGTSILNSARNTAALASFGDNPRSFALSIRYSRGAVAM